MKILIVDDDPRIARGIKRGLIGDDVTICDGGEAALVVFAAAEAASMPFDVVLTDMKKPEMTGLELIDVDLISDDPRQREGTLRTANPYPIDTS